MAAAGTVQVYELKGAGLKEETINTKLALDAAMFLNHSEVVTRYEDFVCEKTKGHALKDVSVVAEIKVSKEESSDRVGIIMGNHDAHQAVSFEVHSSGRLRVYWNKGKNDWFCNSSDMRDGNWHTVAFTRSSLDGKMRLYCDGKLLEENSKGTNDVVLHKEWIIGGDHPRRKWFKGDIRNVFAFDRVLEQDELQRFFNHAEEQRLKEEEEKRLQAEKEDRLKELTEENKELKKSVEEYKKLKQLYDMNRERLKKENCLAIFIGNSNYKKLFTRVSIVKREMEKIKSIFGNATNWTFEQHIDVTLDQWNSLMHVELPKLRKKLKPKVILFYYLGHGVQIDNEDFFVSQDEKLIKVDWIKNNPDVQESNAIVICNCCRENLTDEQEQTLVDASDEFEDLGFHMKELRKGALHACFVVDKRLKEYYKPGKATRFASTFEEIMQKRLKQEDAFDLVHVLMETNTSLQSLKCTYKECDKLEPGEYRIHGGIVAPFFTNQS